MQVNRVKGIKWFRQSEVSRMRTRTRISAGKNKKDEAHFILSEGRNP